MRNHDDDRELEFELRRSLHTRAGHAPAAAPLADRILATVERPAVPFAPPRRRHTWRTWGLPLIAAGAAAAVVGTVAAVQSYQPVSNGVPAINSHTSTSPTARPVAPAPTTPSTRPATTGPATTPPAAATTATVAPKLHGVRLLDLTFTGAQDGWALASAACLHGAGRCTALLRTTDGHTWTSVPGTPFNVPDITSSCAAPCVTHLRFANDRIGYAWGDHALLMTTDGGASWTTQPGGGAKDLETLNGVVVRVRAGAQFTLCSTVCDIQTAPLGSSSWTTRPLPIPRSQINDLRDLGFAGDTVIVSANTGPGVNDLLVSTDRGATWQNRGNPCVSELSRLAGGADGAIVAECSPHQGGTGQSVYLTVSTDGGVTFGAHGTAPRQSYSTVLAAPSARTLLVAYDASGGHGSLWRSTDGGRTWSEVFAARATSISASYEVYGVRDFLGFENGSDGRYVAGDQNTVATTGDAGATWTSTPLG